MAEPVLEFVDVTHRYAGAGAPAVEHVSFRVEKGERLGLLGPNGGGKSTVLKIALGLVTGYEGRVRVCGMSPARARLRGLIGYLPQRCEATLDVPMCVRQVVEQGAIKSQWAWKRTPRNVRELVQRSMELVGADGDADRRVGELSGGQLQRALIARALASGPELLALDEPMVGVDVVGQQRFAGLLKDIHTELGVTTVIVTHDVRVIAAGCDRVACLSRTLHFHDSPSGLTPQVLAEVFRHDVAGAFGDVHVDAHRASDCPSCQHEEGGGDGDR